MDTLVVDEEEVNQKTRPWLDTFATKFGCKVMMFKDGNVVPFGSSQKKTNDASDLPETNATRSGKFQHGFIQSRTLVTKLRTAYIDYPSRVNFQLL